MVLKHAQLYFVVSLVAHLGVLLIFICGYEFYSPIPVFENTNKNDVISAVVLGDSVQSKLLTQPQTALADAAKLLAAEKQKLAEQKAQAEKKQREQLAKEMLADISKLEHKQKQVKQKQLQSHFKKTLQQQTEASMRQQLLDEDVKLQAKQSREAQGQVNKFKALILQAISEHWLVPPEANKKLSCELMIRLAPGGMVLDVQVTKTSGDPALDSSARAAVLKASPLPVPADTNAFELFRHFILKVKPENILTALAH